MGPSPTRPGILWDAPFVVVHAAMEPEGERARRERVSWERSSGWDLGMVCVRELLEGEYGPQEDKGLGRTLER